MGYDTEIQIVSAWTVGTLFQIKKAKAHSGNRCNFLQHGEQGPPCHIFHDGLSELGVPPALPPWTFVIRRTWARFIQWSNGSSNDVAEAAMTAAMKH